MEFASKYKEVQAEWHLDLYCDCPSCSKHVNLTEADDFWVDRNLQACEQREGVEVYCPACGHEFTVTTVY